MEMSLFLIIFELLKAKKKSKAFIYFIYQEILIVAYTL
jgi:hypothetical protein